MADIEVELSDDEFAQIEAIAALRGETVQQFCERAIEELVARLRAAQEYKT